jgi:hypothetical protein
MPPEAGLAVPKGDALERFVVISARSGAVVQNSFHLAISLLQLCRNKDYNLSLWSEAI